MNTISEKIHKGIRQKALELKQISSALKAALPQDCHSHIEVANILPDQLVVLTDSPIWQTRLRMYSQAMLISLSEHTRYKPARITIKLIQPQRLAPAPTRHKPVLSSQSANVIQQTANAIADPELKLALQKLSQKARRRIDTD